MYNDDKCPTGNHQVAESVMYSRAEIQLKALTHYKDFSKTKSLGKSLSLYKTDEKVVAVVKKSCSVYGR